MNINNAIQISGWMAYVELEWLATQAEKHTRILEVGSWMGRSTRALADNTRGVVHAVDPWSIEQQTHPDLVAAQKGKPKDWLFNQFCENMKDFNVLDPLNRKVIPVRMTSLEAANAFKQAPDDNSPFEFDMIFIDGSHDYEDVRADIEAWLPLLSDGGLICGHDYGQYEGVTQAVDELLGAVETVRSIWFKA
jgi:predicted O-methyltransferase YrrM